MAVVLTGYDCSRHPCIISYDSDQKQLRSCVMTLQIACSKTIACSSPRPPPPPPISEGDMVTWLRSNGVPHVVDAATTQLSAVITAT